MPLTDRAIDAQLATFDEQAQALTEFEPPSAMALRAFRAEAALLQVREHLALLLLSLKDPGLAHLRPALLVMLQADADIEVPDDTLAQAEHQVAAFDNVLSPGEANDFRAPIGFC